MNDSNINLFLKQTSEPQNIFEYNSVLNEYKFLSGHLIGLYISDVVVEDKDGLKEYLKELYNHSNTNVNTKMIIAEIIKKHYK